MKQILDIILLLLVCAQLLVAIYCQFKSKEYDDCYHRKARDCFIGAILLKVMTL